MTNRIADLGLAALICFRSEFSNVGEVLDKNSAGDLESGRTNLTIALKNWAKCPILHIVMI
jgi:hypothetical protein